MGKKYVKMNLKFDESKREEFLTGFSKRKEERKKKARRELDKQVKEERAKIRKNKREGVQNRLEEIHNIKMNNEPVVGTICEDVDTKTLELPDHDVMVVEADLFDPVNSMFMGNNVSEGEEEQQKEEETTKKTFNAKKHAESLSKLSKTQQRLKAKKHSSSGRVSKQTKKFLKKKHSNPGKKKH